MKYPTALEYPTVDVFPSFAAAQSFHQTRDIATDFRRHGYVFLPGLLDRSEVLDVRQALLEIAHDTGWLDVDAPVGEGRSGPRAVGPGTSEEYLAAYTRVQSTEKLHRLGHSTALLETVAAIVEQPIFCLPLKMARYAFPERLEGYASTPFHQDYFYVQGSADLITAWVPLGDYSGPGSGRLAVLSQSHAFGLWGADWLEELPGDDVKWRIGDFRAGDVLLFHCLTVHRSEPNERDHIRLSVDYRYQPVADPVVPTSIRPHFDVAPWDDLYCGWSDETPQHYWEELDLTVIPRLDDLGAHRGTCHPTLTTR